MMRNALQPMERTDPVKERREAHLKKARVFWAKRYGREVTDAEIAEIDRNLFGYYSLLLQWIREEDRKKEPDARIAIGVGGITPPLI